MSDLLVTVGGVLVSGPSRPTEARALVEGLTINQSIDGTPNTATFRLYLAAVEPGDEVLIGLDALTGDDLLFGGLVLAATQVHPTEQAGVAFHDVNAIGSEHLLNRILVNLRFTATSATTVVAWVMDNYTVGFTHTGLEASLPVLDEITFTNETVTGCLDRIAKRIGGNWVMSPERDLQFGLDILTGGVTDITSADPAGASTVALTEDLSQVRTRVYVEGGGSPTGAAVAAYSSVLPMRDASWYAASGGQAAVGPLRVLYASTVDGLGGALVGTNVTPAGAVTVALAGGTGVTTGAHKYKHTFVTGAGETVPGPESASITTGAQIAAPSSAPTGTKMLGGNLTAGVYSWKVTYYDGVGGETTPSSASGNVTMDGISAPSNAPVASAADGDANMDANEGARYVYTFKNGSFETTPSPQSNTVAHSSGTEAYLRWKIARSGLSTPPAGAGSIQFYRGDFNAHGGSYTPFQLMQGPSDGMGADDSNYYYETTATGPHSTLGGNAPSSNTMTFRRATVSLPVSPDAGTVGRKLYRTAAGGGTWKLAATIANNTATSHDDNLADASLGANAPASNTATLGKVQVSGISAGPSGTTSRKLYRTVAAGSTFKLLTTIADNTTTTYLDATADGSLGANAPASDTSGLVQETGNVVAGSTTLPVTAPGPFESSGGWAYIGALAVRYTGKSASALTGVPASGDGSLSTDIRYGSVIVAAPMLIGIPTGVVTGALHYPTTAGEPVNVVAQADDAAAQAAMATAVGGHGIHEEYLQDNRLSEAEALDRATARLTEVKDPLVTFRYRTRDETTRAGKTVTVNLGAPANIVGTFRIQRVSVRFDPTRPAGEVVPSFDVEASSRLFTFEQLLRVVQS